MDDRTLNHGQATSGGTPLTTGCELSVTPQIGLETSEVTITATFNTLTGTTPQGTPIVSTRYISTVVRVTDGKPIVIGGLKRSEEIDMYTGMSFLGRIPVIKYLVGNQQNTKRETDFIIMLTPKVIVGAESDLLTATDSETRDMVVGTSPLELPSSPIGYDQWLLDVSKTDLR